MWRSSATSTCRTRLCLTFCMSTQPSPWPQLLLSEKAWMSHTVLCSFTDNIHSMKEQGHQFTSRMVAGDIQRLPEGKHHLRRLSKTTHPDQRASPGGRKKLQVIICVLLVELCERFTFFGIVCNMILFCTVKLGYDNYLAATVNLCFIGASTLTPVLVGWFAETCLGRTKVLYLCAFLHFFGKTQLAFIFLVFEWDDSNFGRVSACEFLSFFLFCFLKSRTVDPRSGMPLFIKKM